MKVRCTGGSRISDLLWLLTEADMMMLPTLCDSSSLRRKSRSLTYTKLVILMLVLVFMLADRGPTLRALVGSVIDAVEFCCSTNNNSLLLIVPSDFISDRALNDVHRRYKDIIDTGISSQHWKYCIGCSGLYMLLALRLSTMKIAIELGW